MTTTKLEVQSESSKQISRSSSSDTPDMRLPPLKLPPNLTFGPFPVTTSQAFYVSVNSLTYALVNLRPLLPGHSLVCPVRHVPRLSQLSDAETTDLFLTVKRVSEMLERVFKADALNVAVQDGAAAGQSVNHVHVHIIPRRDGDVANGDEVYEWMDGQQGNLGKVWEEYQALQRQRRMKEEGGEREIQGGPDADAKRVNRTEEQMREEAEWLRWEMQRQKEFEEMRGAGQDSGDGTGEMP
ncbi:Dinucleoside triphosphate hydrolase [Lithohypha guttulata]|nr:Dinucleoside triphosphate hydrolase [Lithohypha guttulata]